MFQAHVYYIAYTSDIQLKIRILSGKCKTRALTTQCSCSMHESTLFAIAV